MQMVKQIHGKSVYERMHEYTQRSSDSECWEWTSYRDPNGYGRLNVPNDKGSYVPMLAHRLAWQFANGRDLDRYEHVMHRCDNPGCVNPAHLRLGSHQDNMADKMRKGRHRYGTSVGEKHGMARLTDDQVREIRASTGSSIKIGEKYGISGRQVRSIRRRESWKHLD